MYTGEYILQFEIRRSIEPLDGNEPNDERVDATPVPSDGAVHGVLESGEQDWFVFGVDRGNEIRIYDLMEAASEIWLYDRDGNLVRMNRFTGDLKTATATTSGPYYLQIVYNDGASTIDTRIEYDILFDFDVKPVTPTPPEEPEVITSEEEPKMITSEEVSKVTRPVSPSITPESPGPDVVIIAALITAAATIIAAIIHLLR